MNFLKVDSGDSDFHQVVEATVHARQGAMTIMRLVFLRGAPDSTELSTMQFGVTPLQSLRLARELLAATEQFIVSATAAPGANAADGDQKDGEGAQSRKPETS